MSQAASPAPLLEVEGLKTWFPIRRGVLRRTTGHLRAVDGVDFTLRRGQTLGLVGESGCGKTTVGRTILRLVPATAGRVTFDGTDVFAADRRTLNRNLRRRMQVVFQDPVGSLNPRMTVGRMIAEPIRYHGLATGRQLEARVVHLLERVGLEADHGRRYPHAFSGGQRQRIGIARALALEPEFIVCDEPVSALDVSIQSQILNLLAELRRELDLAYLFIAHNLAVVEHFSDRVAVMYLGRIVEIGDRDAVYDHPAHPYTRALLSAAPQADPGRASERLILPGEVPSPAAPPSGCPFHPRCALTRERAAEADARETVPVTIAGEPVRLMRRCVREVPPLEPTPTSGPADDHSAACFFQQEAPASAVASAGSA